MADLGDFDSRKHADMKTFRVIPKGDYPMQIVKSERKTAATGNGDYLNLHIEVITGDYKGSMVFPKLNLWHVKDSTVQMANEELATICRAVGAPPNPRNSEVLHRIPFIGSVDVTPPTEKWPKESNVITKYAPYDVEKAQSVDSSAGHSVQSKSVPDWAKKTEEPAESFDGEPTNSTDNDDIPL